MIKRRLSWFYKDLIVVFSIFLATIILCFSLCLSLEAKANINVDNTNNNYYYSDYIYRNLDTNGNIFNSMKASNTFFHTNNNSDWWIFCDYQEEYVYAVLNLIDYWSNLSLHDRYYLNIYTKSIDAESFYITNYNGIYYLSQFGYCDLSSMSFDTINSDGYFVINNTYVSTLNLANFAFGVDIDIINNNDVVGWILPIADNGTTNFNVPSLIFKFDYDYYNSLIGSNSPYNLIPYNFIEDYQYNNIKILYNEDYDIVDSGYDIGYSQGLNDGFYQGRYSGNTSGYVNGYSDGYNDGLLESSADYGIHDLFFSILDIPLEILSSLFSFTIFGTVAWSLIASFIVLGLVIWLIRKFFR